LHSSLQKLYESNQYKNNLNVEFIKISTYKNAESSGKVNVEGLNLESLKDKNVLVIEDIVDQGITMMGLVEQLISIGCKDVQTAVLIDKTARRIQNFDLDMKFRGFVLEKDYFLVGFGMDYNNQFRDLKHLAAISESGLKKFQN